jgi:hypothetical protein
MLKTQGHANHRGGESVRKLLVVAAAMAGLMMVVPMAGAQNAGISGKWHFVLNTDGGDREMDAEFSVDADGKVTGKLGKSDVAGTYKDGKMDLSFPVTSEESGDTAPLKLAGKIDDSAALTGTWEFSSYNGTFKATRPAP